MTAAPELGRSACCRGQPAEGVSPKWLHRRPDILLLDAPTVGVDVGTKAEIYELLRAEGDRGVAILMVSSDLEEVILLPTDQRPVRPLTRR
ncbi:hypothetical protein [Mesorhizobium sp.]|uniref:hypothetical protein n=1 Tax=Mesorhizobium sp. TaxID=1871066 RepID=UPI0025D19379|nr:hypothetical protein [Mesorhizobium sp.]